MSPLKAQLKSIRKQSTLAQVKLGESSIIVKGRDLKELVTLFEYDCWFALDHVHLDNVSREKRNKYGAWLGYDEVTVDTQALVVKSGRIVCKLFAQVKADNAEVVDVTLA